jgi:putative transposase
LGSGCRSQLLHGTREQVRERHDREDDDEPAGVPAIPRSRRPLSGGSRQRRSSLRPLEIDERVSAFLSRPIEGSWPYLWIDATYVKVREAGRIVSVAVIIAVAVNTDGRREVLGLEVGPSEAEPFWTKFLRSHQTWPARREACDLRRARRPQEGHLQGAQRHLAALPGALMRNALAHVGAKQRQMVAAAIRTAFTQETPPPLARNGVPSPTA